MRCVIGRIHMALRSYCVLDILLHSIIIVQDYSQALNTYVCRVSCGGVFNTLLVLSISFYFHYDMWGCLCSTGPFQLLKGYIYSSCLVENYRFGIHKPKCGNRLIHRSSTVKHHFCAIWPNCSYSSKHRVPVNFMDPNLIFNSLKPSDAYMRQ